jgi:hypothetical protein
MSSVLTTVLFAYYSTAYYVVPGVSCSGGVEVYNDDEGGGVVATVGGRSFSSCVGNSASVRDELSFSGNRWGSGAEYQVGSAYGASPFWDDQLLEEDEEEGT